MAGTGTTAAGTLQVMLVTLVHMRGCSIDMITWFKASCCLACERHCLLLSVLWQLAGQSARLQGLSQTVMIAVSAERAAVSTWSSARAEGHAAWTVLAAVCLSI